MTLRILGQRVLVRPDKRQIAMPEGLVAPDTAIASDVEISGVVEQIGPGVTTVQIGDRVMFAPAAGYEVQVNSQRWLMIPEEHLMAVAEAAIAEAEVQ